MSVLKTAISIGPWSSLLRAAIFTCGHFVIDVFVISWITGAPIELAGLAALVGPIINGVWFWTFDRMWSTMHQADESQHRF